MTPTEALASLGLNITSEFVPFSLSRNNGKTPGREAWPSLNWSVTVLRNERKILTLEYSSGTGHCPSNDAKAPGQFHGNDRAFQRLAVAWEIENGFHAAWSWGDTFKAKRRPATQAERDEGKRDMVRIALLPKLENVFYSVTMDIVDQPFEGWAGDMGYSTDSIKDKALYDLCVDHTMRLRSAIGDAGIETLREAFQDY